MALSNPLENCPLKIVQNRYIIEIINNKNIKDNIKFKKQDN